MSGVAGIKIAVDPIKGSAAKGCDRDPVTYYLFSVTQLSRRDGRVFGGGITLSCQGVCNAKNKLIATSTMTFLILQVIHGEFDQWNLTVSA